VNAAAAGTLTKTNYTFAGWNTIANGTGTSYSAGASISITSNTTLFAQWTALPTYSLTYNGNTNTGGTAPTTVTGIVSGASVNAAAAGTLTKTNYTFTGWNTLANGTGTSYSAGASISITSNTTLFAQWTINSYTVSFDKNDANATGTMTSQTIASGSSAYLKANAFTKSCWLFDGWTSSTGVVYADGAYYTMGTANVTMYAKWKESLTITTDYLDSTSTSIVCEGNYAYLTAAATSASGTLTSTWYGDGRQLLPTTDYKVSGSSITINSLFLTVGTHKVYCSFSNGTCTKNTQTQTIEVPAKLSPMPDITNTSWSTGNGPDGNKLWVQISDPGDGTTVYYSITNSADNSYNVADQPITFGNNYAIWPPVGNSTATINAGTITVTCKHFDGNGCTSDVTTWTNPDWPVVHH
jgi:uncharacterized repeat protein (TIGR02543 family)